MMPPLTAAKDQQIPRPMYLDEETPSLCSSTEESLQSCTKQRSLSFASSLEVIQPTIHKEDYSPEEKAATWYGVKELKSFRRDRRETIKQVEEGNSDTDTNICTRGVEALTKVGARRRHAVITLGLSSVLDEQELQDLDGKENPDMLAHIYKLHTLRSQAAAYERGLRDQQEVLDAPISPALSLFQLF
jgi:hypothetical protein